MNQEDILVVYEVQAAKGTILMASREENKEAESIPGFIRKEKYVRKDALKNALIINGHIYAAKHTLYGPFIGNVCEKCDLRKRCERPKNCSNLCAPFEKSGYVPYFKKLK